VKECPQCHVPPAECRPYVKHPLPMRARLDMRRDAEQAVEDGQSRDVTSFITEAAQVRLGYLRCDRGRCLEHGAPVPVEFGNLTGRPLSEWIADAVREVDRQHPHHEPVTIGARPAPVVFMPPTPDPLQRARARTAVFMEPGSEPHITPAPERSKKGRAAS
jgi:hypothetical protein